MPRPPEPTSRIFTLGELDALGVPPETLRGLLGVQQLTREVGGVREECLLVPAYLLDSTPDPGTDPPPRAQKLL